MGIDRNLPIDDLLLALVEQGRILELRKDTSTTERTIFGYAEVGTASSAAEWVIFAEDQVGSQFHRQFAEVASVPTLGFVHIWDDRDSILPAKAFINEFSVQFSGFANSYGIVQHSPDISFANTDAFSLMVWAKTTNGSQFLMQKTTSSGGNNGYGIESDSSDRIIFNFRGSGTGDRIRVRTDSFTAADDGNWHLYIITKASGSAAASTVKVYVDAVDEPLNILNDTLSGSTTDTSIFTVAANIGGGTRFDGNIDEVAIFDVELSQTDVTEIFNLFGGVINLRTASASISDNLISWWRMGDESFIAIPDMPDEIGANDMILQSAVTSGDIETEVPP